MADIFKKEVRVLLAGGGTGGHIFPLQAVAEELRGFESKMDFKLRLAYVGPAFFPQEAFESRGIEIYPVHAGKWRRYGSVQNIGDLFLIIIGFFQALWRTYLFMPDVIFSKGGYGALPAALSSIVLFIPLVIHESDIKPGMVNSYFARKAKRIAVSFSETLKYFSAEKMGLTGNPVRRIFTSAPNPERLRSEFEFDPNRKTLFILGGSQGSKALNDFILDIMPDILQKYQIIHQCGAANYESVREQAEFTIKKMMNWEQSRFYKLYGFLLEEDFRDALALSDLVIARAGSGTIFEIAVMGKPSILIPLPTSAEDHQRLNAYAYAEFGAAVILEQENLKPRLLLSEIELILSQPNKLEIMSAAAKKFAKPDAAAVVAAELLLLARINVVNYENATN